ncbi:hypothetical protein GCM10011313_08400 [Mycetocola zhadangensis]|nr:hypothetical protein GCM10011313_08400 [Mycetocola zhadangensis]
MSVFPSTTAAALATFATGTLPGRHGLVGYRALDAENDRVVNQLSGWDELMVPETWQRERTVFETAGDDGIASFAIGQAKYASSGFTRAILRGARYVPANSLADRRAAAVRIAREHPGSLTYLYIPELDKASHQYGWESDQWLNALESVDAELHKLSLELPVRTGLLVTADHGSIDVPGSGHILFDTAPELIQGVRHVGGEPRCLHLYLEAGATAADREAVASVWNDSEGDRAWVATREDVIASGLLGDVAPDVVPRIGDVMVAARKRVVYYDSRPADQSARRMIGQHGSLTHDERSIPLIRLGAFRR